LSDQLGEFGALSALWLICALAVLWLVPVLGKRAAKLKGWPKT
jgi:hypothetical protein